MQYKESSTQDTQGVLIEKENERIFNTLLSIKTHSPIKSAETDALYTVYCQILLSGCGTYSREAFLNAVNLLGASISVDIGNGILIFTLSSLDTNHSKLMLLFKTMLSKPTFSAQELKRIKELLKNELIEETEDAKSRSFDELVNTLYATENRRHTFTPNELSKALELVTISSLKKLHADVLAKQWIYTIAANPQIAKKTQQTILSLRKLFATNTITSQTFTNEIHTKKAIILTSIPSKQNIEMSIGSALPVFTTDPSYAAFVFGLNVLGKWGGFAGRLMSIVREKEGLTYGIYARVETTTKEEYGYWRIMTFFSPEKAVQGLTSTLREIQLIRTKGITQHEYERFKNILKTGQVLIGDSILKRIQEMHSFQLREYSYKQMEEFKEMLMNVTKAEVNKALATYIHEDALVISAAGPIEKVRKELSAFGA